MKLNRAEMLVVNNPARVLFQRFEIGWMKRRRPVAAGGAILEIGCGRGAAAALIDGAFSPRLLCASDLDFGMLGRAMKYLTSEKLRRISLCAADALHLPYADRSFDALFGFGVLHHIADWRGALGEIARVLRPGGVYFLEEIYPGVYRNFIARHIFLHPEENRFSSEQLIAAVQSAGFSMESRFEVKPAGILAVLRIGG